MPQRALPGSLLRSGFIALSPLHWLLSATRPFGVLPLILNFLAFGTSLLDLTHKVISLPPAPARAVFNGPALYPAVCQTFTNMALSFSRETELILNSLNLLFLINQNAVNGYIL